MHKISVVSDENAFRSDLTPGRQPLNNNQRTKLVHGIE